MERIKKKTLRIGILFLCIIIGIALKAACLYAKEETTEKDSDAGQQWTVKWQGLTCSGVYYGEVKEGRPNGQGVFRGNIIIRNQEKGEIEYRGKWKTGVMQGQGELIDYEQKKVYEGEFVNNRLHGQIKESSLEEKESYTYIEKYYYKDVPYGMCRTYNKKKISDYDYYFQGISVNQICEEADTYKYTDLIGFAKEKTFKTIELPCIVKEINYDDEESENIVRVEAQEGHSYILTYNVSYTKVAKNYMPFLKIGDKITVFGYYTGFHRHSDGVEYPFIDAVIATRDGKKALDPNRLQYVYEELMDYPYLYYNCAIRLSGSAKDVYKVEKKWIFFYFEAAGDSAEKETYICKVRNNKENLDKFLSQGQVDVHGVLKLIKIRNSEEESMEAFPVVEVRDILTGK